MKAYELISTYPEAGPAIKRRIKVLKGQLNDLLLEEREIKNTAFAEDWDQHRVDFQLGGIEFFREIAAKELRENEMMLHLLECEKKGIEKPELNIEKAKAFPIDRLLDFNRGSKVTCLWHNDKNPSLHYYKKQNRVHCFSCGANKDAIDVVMALNPEKSFKDAVSYLNSTLG